MATLDHYLGPLVLVPPIGLGESFLPVALGLSFACLLAVIFLGRGVLRTGRMGAFAPAVYSLMALTLILGAVTLWDKVM